MELPLLHEIYGDLNNLVHSKEYGDNKDIIRLRNKYRTMLQGRLFETPAQYKKRTGKKWNGAVWLKDKGISKARWQAGENKYSEGYYYILCAASPEPPPDDYVEAGEGNECHD